MYQNTFIVNTDGGSDWSLGASRARSVRAVVPHRLREQHPAQRGWKLPDSLRPAVYRSWNFSNPYPTWNYCDGKTCGTRIGRISAASTSQGPERLSALRLRSLAGGLAQPVARTDLYLQQSSGGVAGRRLVPTAMPRISLTTATTTMKRRRLTGARGVGRGPLSSRPSSCTPGVAYWATDQGEWDSGHSGPDGQLYKCVSNNTWSLYYTPYVYPHPLVSGGRRRCHAGAAAAVQCSADQVETGPPFPRGLFSYGSAPDLRRAHRQMAPFRWGPDHSSVMTKLRVLVLAPDADPIGQHLRWSATLTARRLPVDIAVTLAVRSGGNEQSIRRAGAPFHRVVGVRCRYSTSSMPGACGGSSSTITEAKR